MLISFSTYSQPQVFNVQQYCVDEAPFRKGQCDISGNEYSFVFMDTQKKEVAFFFTDMKFKYKITEVQSDTATGSVSYSLTGDKGTLEMKINMPKTKIEFLYPDTHIYLTVGKSTKLTSSKQSNSPYCTYPRR